MENLDFDKYQGLWYLIQFGPPSGSSLPCIKESYARNKNPNLGDVHWSAGVVNASLVESTGLIVLNYNFGLPWVIYLDGWRFDSTVISTDYTTWAIEYTIARPFNIESNQLFERVMIKSRTATLEPTVLRTLHPFIEGLGFSLEFQVVDHTVC